MNGGRLTIRARIAGGSLIIAVLTSIVAGLIINSQIERIVRDGTVSVLASESAPFVVALSTRPHTSFDAPGPAQRLAVVAPDETTPVNSLPDSIGVRLPTLIQNPGAASVHIGSKAYIVLVTPVDVRGDGWYVVAARSDVQEADVLSQMRALLIVSLAIIALGVGVTAWLLTSASLAPVQRLRESAEKLSAVENLTAVDSVEMLPVGRAQDEISRLAETLNELIGRLRASASRERQLVSDASHELRTPIAILTTQLQLAADETAPAEQLLTDIEGARRNVARLAALVTSLLELSSYEAVGGGGEASAAQLDREAEDAVEWAAFRAAGTEVEIDFSGFNGAGTGVFPIRAEDFGRLVENLCSNSLRALGASGRLTVELHHSGSALSLVVSDTGGGLSPAFEAHALERFTREDSARRSDAGAGLGLAIVAAIVANAHGTISLGNRPGVGLTVTITIPSLQTPAVEAPRNEE